MLELGCGTGRILIPLVEKGIAVEGVDISAGMLELLTEKARLRGIAQGSYHLYREDMVRFCFRDRP